jgi:hemolysin III
MTGSTPTPPTAGSGTAAAPAPMLPRPSWRGWIHTVMAPVALVLGLSLLIWARSPKSVFAVLVFTVASTVLFGMSALYHRVAWAPRTKRVLRRCDHANIFLLIAGSYTPISLLALPPVKGWPLFFLVWTIAVLGIAFNVFWITAPRWLYVGLYLAMGWLAMMYVVDFFRANAPMMTLILVGGLFYTLGAVAYWLRRPNFWPTRFGFHEVFHAATAVAYLCHWAAVLLAVLHPLFP